MHGKIWDNWTHTRITTMTIEKGQTNLLLRSTRLHNVLTQQNALAIHLFSHLRFPSVNKAHYFQTKEPCEKRLQTTSETWSHIDIMNNFNRIPHTGPVALNVTWVSEQHNGTAYPKQKPQIRHTKLSLRSTPIAFNYYTFLFYSAKLLSVENVFLAFKRKKNESCRCFCFV